MKLAVISVSTVWVVFALAEGRPGIHLLNKRENPKVIRLDVEKQLATSTPLFEQMVSHP